MLPGPVHPGRPEIGGFCFSETAGLSIEQANAMAATGQLFLTEFRAVDVEGRVAKYGGSLIASDWAAAEEEAKRRGLGEVVVGKLYEQIAA